MEGHQTSEDAHRLAIIRHDESLKDLLRIHLTGADAERREGEPAHPDLMPALLGAYQKLDVIRHDFPVVLVDDEADMPLASLASIFDDLLGNAVSAGDERESLQRNGYRLEATIRRLADTRPNRRLSELWELAVGGLAEGAQRARVRASLEAAEQGLGKDGRLLTCSPRAARRIFEHAWEPLESERARRESVVLDELIARLSEVLESERARSPKSRSPQALEAALGGEHAGIDFESLSSLLRSHRHARVTPVKRTKRLHAALKVIESERALLPMPEGNGRRRRRARRPVSVFGSCADALKAFQAELQRRVELLQAIRVAQLELENRYQAERHDPFFETFGPGQLTPEEYRALPPVLVILNGDELDDAEKVALLDILGSDMPVKVLLQVRELPVGDTAGAPPGTFTEWTRQVAAMACALDGAFVMQTSTSQLPRLVEEIVRGLRYEGPALFSVYAGPDEPDSAVPTYLRCASAVESRAFPSFVYDPGSGVDLAARFSLAGSPQVERAWPAHPFAYEDPDGREVNENLVFTCLDFLALDPRFSKHFVPVARERWHANMVPIADYLDLPSERTLDKVPYVYLVDDEDRLHRVVIRRALVTFARKSAANWRKLQELAGIHSSHVARLLEQERQRAAATVETAGAPQAETPAETVPAATEEADALAPTPPAEVAKPGKAYIDTDMCTSCDDCIERNPSLFAYNEDKQAYVRNIEAGTYRDLVEAAENCPVCIIHPGLPLCPDEPGLDELLNRAAPFN